MASILTRAEHVVVDQLGMDPLRDKSYENIRSIQDWTHYTVSDSDKFNAPLISYNLYDTPDLWWAILVYNGIPDMFALVPGLRLRIPNQNAIISALAREQERQPSNRVMEI